jgi:hypothetical protein
MMSIALLIYLAGVSDNIVLVATAFGAFGFATLVALLVAGICAKHESYVDETEKASALFGYARRVGVFAAIAVMVATLLPNRTTLYMMAGAEIASSATEDLTPELEKVRELLNRKLDDALGSPGSNETDE